MKMTRRITILFLAVMLVAFGAVAYKNNTQSQAIVRAFGHLTVNFPSEPMFDEANWAPGKLVTKSFSVKNTDIVGRKIGISAKDIAETGSPGLSQGLSIIISQSGTPLYGEGSSTGLRTLTQFYTTPVVWLTFLPKGATANYDITISMDMDKGNEFQSSSTVFNLFVGIDNAVFPTIVPLPTFPLFPTLRPLPAFKRLPTFRPIPTIRKF